jgi:hypothetical protein
MCRVGVLDNAIDCFRCTGAGESDCEFFDAETCGVVSNRCWNNEARYDALLQLAANVRRAKCAIGAELKKEKKP